MKKSTLIKKFRKFLKNKGLWEEYKICLKNEKEITLEKFFQETPAYNWIFAAFVWQESPSGSFTWSLVDLDWINIPEVKKVAKNG